MRVSSAFERGGAAHYQQKKNTKFKRRVDLFKVFRRTFLIRVMYC